VAISKYLVRVVTMPANIIVPAILALTVIGLFSNKTVRCVWKTVSRIQYVTRSGV